MKKSILSLLIAIGLIGSASASVLSGELTNGLVSYYAFNGNYNDSGPAQNDLSNLHNVSLTTNRFGEATSAIVFNSSDAFALSQNSTGINGNQPRTISFWVLMQTPISSGYYQQTDIYSMGNVDPNVTAGTAFSMHLRSNENGQIYAGGGYSDYVASNINESVFLQWNMISYVYGGSYSQSQLYLNGQVISSYLSFDPNTQLNTPDFQIRLGDRGDGRNLEIPGTVISDFSVWNTALSSTQVSQLYSLQSIPEPSTCALFGIGAVGMLMVMRRKKTA